MSKMSKQHQGVGGDDGAPKQSLSATTSKSGGAVLGTIHSTPDPKELSKRSGLFHTTIKREKSNGLIWLSVQDVSKTHKNNSASSSQHPPLLMAHKNPDASYSVHLAPLSDSRHDEAAPTLVGQLVLTSKTTSYISYALYRQPDRVQLASILYRVPSILTAVRMKNQLARTASVALAEVDGTAAAGSPAAGGKLSSWFEDVCEASIHQTGSLASLDNESSLSLCHSNTPYMKSDGHLGLNFHGRGMLASKKNMQLVAKKSTGQDYHGSDKCVDTGTVVVCQMAKCETDVYNLDFCGPFTPMTAFGFCLAQMDL